MMVISQDDARTLWLALATRDDPASNSIRSRIEDRLAEERDQAALLKQYRDAAWVLHVSDGVIEIDDPAAVSMSDTGAYVQAWVWVPDEEAGVYADPDHAN